MRSASDFIVQTNDDVESTHTHAQSEKSTILGLEIFLEESKERRECMRKKWNSLVSRQEKKRSKLGEGKDRELLITAVSERTLLRWMKAYPIMNECTHFGCILDPKTATIRWLERGVQEVDSADGVEIDEV